MKKLYSSIFIGCILPIILSSCSDTYKVRVENGSIVKVIDYYDKDYKEGDTVCISYYSASYEWRIDNIGNMYNDTIIDNCKYKIGVIK